MICFIMSTCSSNDIFLMFEYSLSHLLIQLILVIFFWFVQVGTVFFEPAVFIFWEVPTDFGVSLLTPIFTTIIQIFTNFVFMFFVAQSSKLTKTCKWFSPYQPFSSFIFENHFLCSWQICCCLLPVFMVLTSASFLLSLIFFQGSRSHRGSRESCLFLPKSFLVAGSRTRWFSWIWGALTSQLPGRSDWMWV